MSINKKNYFLIIINVLTVSVLQVSASEVIHPEGAVQIYPSTSTAWVIPGYHDDSYDPMGYPISTKEELINWELNHADIAFGSNYDEPVGNQITNLGYMYTQKIDFSPRSVEFGLRAYAESVNENFEDYYLHFSQDTIIQILNPTHSEATPLNRRPWIAGFTWTADHSGNVIWQIPPYAIQPFKDSDQGGCLFIYMPEKFDQIELVLSQVATTGQLEINYPSAIDVTTSVVNQWGTITTGIVDETNGLRVSGSISWRPPTDWIKAATFNPVNNTGQHFGNKFIKSGQKSYVVKICRVNEDIDDQPTVQNILTKDFVPKIGGLNEERLIRGWDLANDLNGDGYIDAVEYSNLVNPDATARFRYESRVTPLGDMWSANSNFQRPDFLNPSYRTAIANVTNQQWQINDFIGAYNDDVFKLSNVNISGSGGIIAEHNIRFNEALFQEQYKNAFLDTIRAIRSETQSLWVSANISAENLFYQQENNMEYIDVFDVFLREDYIRPGLGLDGYFGFAKMWETFALGFAGKKSLIMAHAGWTGSIPLENTQSQWQARIATGLAMYYLLNIPEITSYTSWNSSYNYGSNNTTEANFYKAGVPKNIAYQPSFMLAYDIGQPTSSIQQWPNQTVNPLIYTARVTLDDYAVIGNSTQSELHHSEIATFDQAGVIPVIPSHIYLAWQSDDTITIGGIEFPKRLVLARDYSNGLVLYYTDFFGGNPDFKNTSREIILPDDYYRLNYDGSLQAKTNVINLRGYEGAILVKLPSDLIFSNAFE